jgi:hypothetical protein
MENNWSRGRGAPQWRPTTRPHPESRRSYRPRPSAVLNEQRMRGAASKPSMTANNNRRASVVHPEVVRSAEVLEQLVPTAPDVQFASSVLVQQTNWIPPTRRSPRPYGSSNEEVSPIRLPGVDEAGGQTLIVEPVEELEDLSTRQPILLGMAPVVEEADETAPILLPPVPPSSEQTPERTPEALPAPDCDPVLEPRPATVAEPNLEPVPEPLPAPVSDPVLEPLPAPVPEPILEPLTTTAPNTVLGLLPTPDLGPLPAPVPEPLLLPLSEPVLESSREAVPNPMLESHSAQTSPSTFISSLHTEDFAGRESRDRDGISSSHNSRASGEASEGIAGMVGVGQEGAGAFMRGGESDIISTLSWQTDGR